MHAEIFITELLGAEIKQQMASHRVAVTPPNTVSHLLHKRQVGLHKIRVGPPDILGDVVPMGGAPRPDGASSLKDVLSGSHHSHGHRGEHQGMTARSPVGWSATPPKLPFQL